MFLSKVNSSIKVCAVCIEKQTDGELKLNSRVVTLFHAPRPLLKFSNRYNF